MKRIVLSIVAVLLVAGAAMADDRKDVKAQINSIKKNNQYIYAEATAASAEEAKEFAEEMLYNNINEWVAKQKCMRNSANIVINNKKEVWSSVDLPRGNMFRSFVYVKKSDIIASDNVTVVKNTSLTEATPATSSVEKIISDVAWEVAACSDYSALAAKITDLKTEGRIEKYGRYASLDSPQEYYLAIYNTAGKIVAILSPGQNRININTKNPDSEKNYSGCGAIGFKVK